MHEDNGKYFIFRYQFCNIHAIASERDEHYCTVIFPNFDDVTEENMLDLVVRCNEISATIKSVKAYIMGDIILAAVEFYCLDENDFDFQMQQALLALVAARVNYEAMKDAAA